jgi:replication fork protection complex subunit Tof1/Swi1
MPTIASPLLHGSFRTLKCSQAFYPKNRGQWKAYSSYEPEVKPKSKPAGKAEVGVKKGFKTSEQIGIAVACLVEEDSKQLIDWVMDVGPIRIPWSSQLIGVALRF